MKLSPEAEALLYQQVDRHVIRRNIAKTLMSGMLANDQLITNNISWKENVAIESVELADALLAALEESV